MSYDSGNDPFLAVLGVLANAFGGESVFPKADAEDAARGARFIPGRVTDARRAGQTVTFVTDGLSPEWYWLMPDGSRVQHG